MLRDLTIVKHKMAEQMPFNIQLMDGKLTKEQYVIYLTSLYHIFDKIEERIKLPDNFLRKNVIKQDLLELINGDDDFEPIPTTKTFTYTLHLMDMDETTIWPHVYLNYMALLFGGQLIKTKIPGSGRLYDFENTQDIIKKIRDNQTDEWADEVNLGYDFMIAIFKELEDLENIERYYIKYK